MPSLYINPRIEQPLPEFKALKFFQKACGLNDGGGCFNLGLMYEKGKGVKQDDFKAFKIFQKACDLNDGSGCSQLGFMYEKGKGVKQDLNHTPFGKT